MWPTDDEISAQVRVLVAWSSFLVQDFVFQMMTIVTKVVCVARSVEKRKVKMVSLKKKEEVDEVQVKEEEEKEVVAVEKAMERTEKSNRKEEILHDKKGGSFFLYPFRHH